MHTCVLLSNIAYAQGREDNQKAIALAYKEFEALSDQMDACQKQLVVFEAQRVSLEEKLAECQRERDELDSQHTQVGLFFT